VEAAHFAALTEAARFAWAVVRLLRLRAMEPKASSLVEIVDEYWRQWRNPWAQYLSEKLPLARMMKWQSWRRNPVVECWPALPSDAQSER
jgi:hypothetical protein